MGLEEELARSAMLQDASKGYADPKAGPPGRMARKLEGFEMPSMGSEFAPTDTSYIGADTSLSPTFNGSETASQVAASDPSMWDKISGWAGQNKDLILAGSMALNDYSKQQKAADIQSNLNQAYAKWSGFSPNLASNIKPVEYPDIATSAMNAFKAGPVLWNDLAGMYEARKKGQLDQYLKEKRNQEALRQGLASGGGK